MPEKLVDTLRELSPTISVGVLTADFMRLERELSLLDGTGVKLLHFDVMDGCFCPMMTVGPPFIRAVKTSLLKDVHLMVEEPLQKLEAFVAAGADIVTLHVESCRYPHRALQELTRLGESRPQGLVRGIALNPGTPLTAVEPLLELADLVVLLSINPGWGGQQLSDSTALRLAGLRRILDREGSKALIGLDGGVTRGNIDRIAGWGADIVVTGSAVFDGKTPAENARFMLSRLRSRNPAPGKGEHRAEPLV
ncbi:MAG: ribulose-phosphate 3-epimerase [Acidobacteriota bacterium]